MRLGGPCEEQHLFDDAIQTSDFTSNDFGIIVLLSAGLQMFLLDK